MPHQSSGLPEESPRSAEQAPTPGLLAAVAALYQFFVEYPALSTLDLAPTMSSSAVMLGPKFDAPDAVEAMQALATALHAPLHITAYQRPTDGARRISLRAVGVYDGVTFYASTHMAAEPYEAFSADHDPDPQAWTPSECREYATFAAHYPQGVAA